ncbi:MAG TPA: tetratricopeptide repeat protein [Terriglobales bacterium]
MRFFSLLCVAVGFLFLGVSLHAAGDPDPETLIKQQHYKHAHRILEQRLSQNPQDLKATELLAKIELEGKQNDDVIRMMTPVVAQNPKNAEYHIILADAYGQKASSDHAGVFDRMSWGKTMKKEGDTALSLDPKNSDALYGMIQFHLQAPGIVGGDRKKAQEYADRLTAFDPVNGNYLQAQIAAQEKHEALIEGFYQKALAANPKSYDALVRIGGFYAGEQHRDFEKSDKYLHQALQIDPGRATAYEILAQTLALREKWTELDQLLAQAEKACPEDFIYYFQAGRVLLNGKDKARAERYFRKYLTQEPEVGRPSWAHAHWRLGLVLEREGKKDQARQEIETALKLNPELKAAEKDLKRVKG